MYGRMEPYQRGNGQSLFQERRSSWTGEKVLAETTRPVYITNASVLRLRAEKEAEQERQAAEQNLFNDPQNHTDKQIYSIAMSLLPIGQGAMKCAYYVSYLC